MLKLTGLGSQSEEFVNDRELTMKKGDTTQDQGTERKLKVLLYGLNHAPEIVGIGRYSGDLAQWLAHRGHAVRVITAPPYFPQWRAKDNRYRREKMGNVEVQRCPLWVPARPSGLTRLIHLASFAASSLPPLLAQRRWKPDVVLTVAPAFFCAPGALLLSTLCRRRARKAGDARTMSWLHIQDLELDAAFELGMLSGGWIRYLAEKWERYTLRKFDRVSTISTAMQNRLIEKGVDRKKLSLVPNWVDLEAIQPQDGKTKAMNGYRKELGLSNESCVLLYSGSMNKKQGLEMLLPVMVELSDVPNLVWLMAGEGPTKAELMEKTERLSARKKGRIDVRWLPLQPAERLNDWLNVADIHLLPQKGSAADLVLPSKLLGILASGRPVVASSPAESELGRLAEQAGLRVEPDDAQGFAQAIRRLAMDSRLRSSYGKSAREIAEKHFGRDAVLKRMEEELQRKRNHE